MQYTIYEYQKQYRDLFQQYHHLQDYLTHLKNDDIYTKKLKQSFYQDVSFLDDIIYNKLSKRKDYKKKGRLHILFNPLTREKSTLIIKNNQIYIQSANKNNIFFYIIYQNLKYYVIIEKKL